MLANPALVKGISRYLRSVDLHELFLTSGRAAEDTLKQGVEISDKSWLAFINGEFAALCGIGRGTTLVGGGRPWLVASPVIEHHPRLFLERSRLLVNEMAEEYGTLYNHVWDGHERAKAWLAAVGFTLEAPKPYGKFGAPFRYFWR